MVFDKKKITTKITRQEMIVAKRANPEAKGYHWREKAKGRDMAQSILLRMDKLINSMCGRAFRRYAHYKDRSMTLEDLISIVRSNLLLSIYRYKRNGKYDPYYYLMGVINVVLRNVHNWRNRKKRIPQGNLVSLDTPRSDSEGNRTTLMDNIGELFTDMPVAPSLIAREDMLAMFAPVFGTWEKIEVPGGIRIVSCGEVITMILDGNTVENIAREYDIPTKKMRLFINEKIVGVI